MVSINAAVLCGGWLLLDFTQSAVHIRRGEGNCWFLQVNGNMGRDLQGATAKRTAFSISRRARWKCKFIYFITPLGNKTSCSSTGKQDEIRPGWIDAFYQLNIWYQTISRSGWKHVILLNTDNMSFIEDKPILESYLEKQVRKRWR